MNVYTSWLFIAVACFVGTIGRLAAQPQDTPFHFSHLSVKEGLSQGSVLSIHQDGSGFMWVGTRDGLYKYDGYSFEIFRHSVNDSAIIAGNIVYDIKSDKNGNIWVVTE